MESNEARPSYIVGIGGSAGGLEAFGEFFSNMPSDSGMSEQDRRLQPGDAVVMVTDGLTEAHRDPKSLSA